MLEKFGYSVKEWTNPHVSPSLVQYSIFREGLVGKRLGIMMKAVDNSTLFQLCISTPGNHKSTTYFIHDVPIYIPTTWSKDIQSKLKDSLDFNHEKLNEILVNGLKETFGI